MAEACANCGRADLLQADVANYQCLACSALTSIATGQVVPSNIPNVTTSPSGHPVIELGHVTESFAGDESGSADPEHRLRPGDPLPHPSPEVAVVVPTPAPPTPSTVDTEPAPVEASAPVEPPAPAPVDLSTLTPEQVAAIEAIAHPEVTANGEADSSPAEADQP